MLNKYTDTADWTFERNELFDGTREFKIMQPDRSMSTLYLASGTVYTDRDCTNEVEDEWWWFDKLNGADACIDIIKAVGRRMAIAMPMLSKQELRTAIMEACSNMEMFGIDKVYASCNIYGHLAS